MSQAEELTISADDLISAVGLLGVCATSSSFAWRPGEPWRVRCDRHGMEASNGALRVACVKLRMRCEGVDDSLRMPPAVSSRSMTIAQVRRARELYAEGGASTGQLAAQHGVSPSVMRQALVGTTYRSAGGPLVTPGVRGGQLSDDEVRRVRRVCAAGAGQAEVAKEYDLSKQAISLVVTRKQYADVAEEELVSRLRVQVKRLESMDIREIESVFLTRQEVAALIGVSTGSITRWVKAGDFPAPVELVPRRQAWRRVDVERWIAERPLAGD